MQSDKILQAGPFNVLYQNGFLRGLKYGSSEILRMIYFALRDENWGTYDAHIQNEEITERKNAFTITYDCFHQKHDVTVFHWKAAIHALPSGQITFEIQGEALQNIAKNRAGFCVLHPIKETVNQPCEIIHPDGTVSHTMFPEIIAPDNPFKNICAMNWLVNHQTYELHFEGDIFETEDQRNWTDASFKTFCTPLDLPFPVTLQKGNIVKQKITFKPRQILSPIVESKKQSHQSHFQKIKLPDIGLAASTETDQLSPQATTLLRGLRLSHYRIEVYPLTEKWVTKLSMDCQNAAALDLPLEVALHLSNQFTTELDVFKVLALQNRIRIKSILLFSVGRPVTDQRVIDEVLQLRQEFPGVKFGAGTDFNFAELNRNQFRAQSLDIITFSIHPQEHAFDDLSLMETIEAHRDVVKSARLLHPALPIYISPITLRKRFNPYATRAEDRIMSNIQKTDKRQKTEFAAQWIKQCIVALAEAGSYSITLFQTVGEQGIIAHDGQPYPVYSALKSFLNEG